MPGDELTGPVGLSALMLILAVPNNPANSLTRNPVTDARLTRVPLPTPHRPGHRRRS